jgi:hypothetical protein
MVKLEAERQLNSTARLLDTHSYIFRQAVLTKEANYVES